MKKKDDRVIVVAASLSKEDLARASAFYGATNGAEFKGYGPGCLMLETFAGKWSPQVDKFLGTYLFSLVEVQVGEVFFSLPGVVANKEKVKRGAKAAESDEVDGNG